MITNVHIVKLQPGNAEDDHDHDDDDDDDDEDDNDDEDDDLKDRIINVQVRSKVSRATNCCLSARTQSGKTPPT